MAITMGTPRQSAMNSANMFIFAILLSLVIAVQSSSPAYAIENTNINAAVIADGGEGRSKDTVMHSALRGLVEVGETVETPAPDEYAEEATEDTPEESIEDSIEEVEAEVEELMGELAAGTNITVEELIEEFPSVKGEGNDDIDEDGTENGSDLPEDMESVLGSELEGDNGFNETEFLEEFEESEPSGTEPVEGLEDSEPTGPVEDIDEPEPTEPVEGVGELEPTEPVEGMGELEPSEGMEEPEPTEPVEGVEEPEPTSSPAPTPLIGSGDNEGVTDDPTPSPVKEGDNEGDTDYPTPNPVEGYEEGSFTTNSPTTDTNAETPSYSFDWKKTHKPASPTRHPSSKPSVMYIPRDSEDTLAEEEEPDVGEFDDDNVLYHGLGEKGLGKVGDYLDGVESPEEMEYDKNVQITAGILSALFLVLLLVTAHLVMQYPDGLCAGCCRLTLKCICCFTRTLCLPCRYICCKGSDQAQGRRTHAPMRTPFPTDLELA